MKKKKNCDNGYVGTSIGVGVGVGVDQQREKDCTESNHYLSSRSIATAEAITATTSASVPWNRPQSYRHHKQKSIPCHCRNLPSRCPLLLVLLCQLIILPRPVPLVLKIIPATDAFQQPGSFILHQQLQLQLQRRRTNKFYHQTFINTNTNSNNEAFCGTTVRNRRVPIHQKMQLFAFPSDQNYNSSIQRSFMGFSTQLHLSSESSNDQSTTTVTSEPTSSSTTTSSTSTKPDVIEIPMPTEAGGYTHTTASRAKISAANRGKTPWNKGKTRSEETKARIAAGVRKKNRERFLKKLEDMGLTEEEYEAQKKEERRKKDAERRARKTANGGYRLTEETKQKISKVLKEKHAKGEVKKREYNGPFRKGFSHSDETKQKIRESLKRKWAEDTDYQKKMRQSSKNSNNESSRSKISKTLKQKWQDPAFRDKMLKAMRENRSKGTKASDAQRAKISAAMKKKWQNAEYRNKAMKGMEQYRESLPPRPKKKKKKMVSKAASTIQLDDVFAVAPIKAGTKKRKRRSSTSVKVGSTSAAKKKTKKKKKLKKKKSAVKLVKSAEVTEGPKNGEKKNGKSKEKKEDGDISRMREERRDLYDLLYGDEPQEIISEEESFSPVIPDPLSESPNPAMAFFGGGTDMLDDENLDDFDPYGLEDR